MDVLKFAIAGELLVVATSNPPLNHSLDFSTSSGLDIYLDSDFCIIYSNSGIRTWISLNLQ